MPLAENSSNNPSLDLDRAVSADLQDFRLTGEEIAANRAKQQTLRRIELETKFVQNRRPALVETET